MAHDILLSFDHGLQWGNHVITPQELAKYIKGVTLLENGIEFDGVKITNLDGREYIMDQDGKRFNLLELCLTIQENNNQASFSW